MVNNKSSIEVIRPEKVWRSPDDFSVIEDWLSDNLSGAIHFIQPDGNIFQSHRFEQNIMNSAADLNFDYVLVSLCGTDKHDAKLICYNFKTGKNLWEIAPIKTGSVVRISDDGKHILLGKPYAGIGTDYLMKISFDGKILERWPDSPYQAIDMARELAKSGNYTTARDFFLFAANADISSAWRAKAYRYLGEMYEGIDDISNAIDSYNLAIQEDPKVGLTKKLKALKQRHQ